LFFIVATSCLSTCILAYKSPHFAPVRFNPEKYHALKDAALYLKSTAPESGVATYSFADHHVVAFYSGLSTYPIKFREGMYIPLSDKAGIVWEKVDIKDLIDQSKVHYIVLAKWHRKVLQKLEKEYELEEVYRTHGSFEIFVYKVKELKNDGV